MEGRKGNWLLNFQICSAKFCHQLFAFLYFNLVFTSESTFADLNDSNKQIFVRFQFSTIVSRWEPINRQTTHQKWHSDKTTIVDKVVETLTTVGITEEVEICAVWTHGTIIWDVGVATKPLLSLITYWRICFAISQTFPRCWTWTPTTILGTIMTITIYSDP